MQSIFKKLGIGLIALFLVSTTAAYIFFRYHIDHMLGGNTQIVDASQFRPMTGKIAITNVSVLSTDGTQMLPKQTVLVDGSKIVAVTPNSIIPAEYQAIDAGGKYLIPGLIDSHVHLKKSKNDLLLYVANGVTQVAEMTGMAHHFAYREQIRNGIIGPNIFIASPKVNSQQSLRATTRSLFEGRHQNFLTAEEGRQAVHDYQAKGYQAIKISSDLDKAIYFAINDEAKRLGIPVIGHLPVGLGLQDLYASGQSQLAHIDSIVLSLMNEHGWLTSSNAPEFIQQITSQADDIAKRLQQQGIALASTVWLHKTRPMQDFDLAAFLKIVELEYQNPGWLEGSAVSRGCLPGSNSYENPHNTDPASQQESAIYHATYFKAIEIITQALVRHGVTLTAGTDALGACGMIAGFSLHKELETLHQLGLTNIQALQAATSVPAKWMSVKTGSITAGYRADLVLLTANPLEDIRHTRSIDSVIANGKYLDRQQLDAMLEAVKQANHQSRKVRIDEFSN